MNHQDATQSMAVEKYALNELSPDLRDEFEEHYFECQECAMDVRATTAFLDAARRRIHGRRCCNHCREDGQEAGSLDMEACCSLCRLWQRACFSSPIRMPWYFRGYTSKLLNPMRPEILPSVSLIGGIVAAVRSRPSPCLLRHPFLLFMDIPTQDRFSTYTCSLYSPAGKLAWQG